MRLFTAIDLPAEMLERLSDFLARVRPLAKLRWTAVENLHITTKFIGEWPEARIDEVKTALRGVTSTGPISISAGGLGWFPDLRRPRVFWAGVQGGAPLGALAAATEGAVAKLGVPVEARVYSPHLTLARVREAVRIDDLLAAMDNPDFGAFQVASFFLYLSHPLPDGRGSVPQPNPDRQGGDNGRYTKLAEFPLNS